MNDRLKAAAEDVAQAFNLLEMGFDLKNIEQVLAPLIKPELDIESAAKELKQRTVPFLMELQDGVNKKSVIGFYRSILSNHFTESQGVDVEALVDAIEVSLGLQMFDKARVRYLVSEAFTDISPLKKRIAELEKVISKYTLSEEGASDGKSI